MKQADKDGRKALKELELERKREIKSAHDASGYCKKNHARPYPMEQERQVVSH